MVAPLNEYPDTTAFASLLEGMIQELNLQAQLHGHELARLLGRNLEPYVRDVLKRVAKDTPFENSIELIGGQKFPDIVVGKYYGIEVKTTSQNHWKTIGNSVLEGTRVEGVEQVFMLFAKLADPIEFRCRPYEDVLSEVVVTHSPRYQIDMNLSKGETIFDKMGLAYNQLRSIDNPIRPIVDYYKRKLAPGEELWWMDTQDAGRASNIVIRIWNNLSMPERQELRNRAMIYFPELFGNRSDKFGRLAIWLVTREAVVCPNVRDLFTAGGKRDYTLKGRTYKQVPRIFLNLFEQFPLLVASIQQMPSQELETYWGRNTTEATKFSDWMNLVQAHADSIQGLDQIDLDQIMRDLLDT